MNPDPMAMELPEIQPASQFPTGHPGKDLLTGRTPSFACRADQRFSYTLQVPSSYRDDDKSMPLLVMMHGTLRRSERYLDHMAAFAEDHGCVVMAPLFPAGIHDPNDVHNYKFIQYSDVRFDLVLLAMLDDVAARWNIDTARFALHGFSGGGQFAHRFLYLHPHRLSVVSIGAPGRVTLPDPQDDWWQGVGNLEQLFGIPWSPEAVAKIPLQLVIGSEDSGADVLGLVESDGHGATRLERIQSLARHLESIGSRPQLDIVHGVAHDALQVLPVVKQFLADRWLQA